MDLDALFGEPRWFNVVGLAFDMLGVLVIAVGVVAPKRQLIEQQKVSGPAYYGAPSEKTVEKSPAFRDRLRQAQTALVGAALLFIGFLLQAVGPSPR